VKAREFIHLSYTGKEPCTLSRNAYSTALKTWLCQGCGRPYPSVQTVDAELGEGPSDAPLTFVSGCGIIVAHRDLLRLFDSERIARDLFLGTVKDRSGKVDPDWLTVRGRRRLIVRGSEDVSHRRCELCGRTVYFAMGEEYLFPAPPPDASIYEGDLTLVVERNVIKDDAALTWWPRLEVKDLIVFEKPRDGLGDLM
jgi:hypothetical protein